VKRGEHTPGSASARDRDRHTCDTKARRHILEGDATGGGHGPGRGLPGKSEFPRHWTDEEVIAYIESVANDRALVRRVQSNGRIVIDGRREGVDIRVIVEPTPVGAGRIITGFPTNLPRNP